VPAAGPGAADLRAAGDWPPRRPDYGPDGTPRKQVPPGTRDARTGQQIRRPAGGGGGGGSGGGGFCLLLLLALAGLAVGLLLMLPAVLP
jgi:hypothetical protein